jgi:hypothetical protein
MNGRIPSFVDLGADVRLAEWLASNPIGEAYSLSNPVFRLDFDTAKRSGFVRWPVVPDAAEDGHR